MCGFNKPKKNRVVLSFFSWVLDPRLLKFIPEGVGWEMYLVVGNNVACNGLAREYGMWARGDGYVTVLVEIAWGGR